MDSGISLATNIVNVQILFYIAGWTIFALVVREERAPIAHWIAFLLFLAIGHFVEELRIRGDDSAALRMISLICFVVSFPLITRGFELFLRVTSHEAEHIVTITILVIACVAINFIFGGRYDMAFRHFVQSMVVLRGLFLIHQAVREQYGLRTHLIVVLCMLSWIGFAFCWSLAALVYPGFADLAKKPNGDGSEIILYATIAGLALFNALFIAGLFFKLVKQVRKLSERDPLTGLFNRRAFHERAAAVMARDGLTYGVLLLDLDHFKQINDRYGHAAGDAVLVATADVLRRETRAGSVVCRWGGEEFAILLNGCGADAAVNIAERIRRAVAEMNFCWQGVSIPLTTSIGVTAARAAPEHIDHYLQRCDQALYRAKAQGRNRWVMAAGEESAESAAPEQKARNAAA